MASPSKTTSKAKATTKSLTYSELLTSIKSGQLAPVYVLHGEEAYYTDKLTGVFTTLVPEEDRDFNLTTLYGADITGETVYTDLLGTCKRYPMMSDRQVVILKDAQSVKADVINKLAPYIESPNPTTVLVLCFRGAKMKGRELPAALRKGGGVVFESVPLKDTAVGPAITAMVKELGLSIDDKAREMLAQYIGTDLSRLNNEVSKLAMILGKGAAITPEAVERNIGISKDYNNFELIKAIANRDANKVLTISRYFRNNPKNNPTVMTVALLFNYFSSLLIYHFTAKLSPNDRAAAMGVRWISPDYQTGAKNYNARQVIEIIAALRECDVKCKGQGSRQNEYDLQFELLWHILNARGVTDVMQ